MVLQRCIEQHIHEGSLADLNADIDFTIALVRASSTLRSIQVCPFALIQFYVTVLSAMTTSFAAQPPTECAYSLDSVHQQQLEAVILTVLHMLDHRTVRDKESLLVAKALHALITTTPPGGAISFSLDRVPLCDVAVSQDSEIQEKLEELKHCKPMAERRVHGKAQKRPTQKPTVPRTVYMTRQFCKQSLVQRIATVLCTCWLHAPSQREIVYRRHEMAWLVRIAIHVRHIIEQACQRDSKEWGSYFAFLQVIAMFVPEMDIPEVEKVLAVYKESILLLVNPNIELEACRTLCINLMESKSFDFTPIASHFFDEVLPQEQLNHTIASFASVDSIKPVLMQKMKFLLLMASHASKDVMQKLWRSFVQQLTRTIQDKKGTIAVQWILFTATVLAFRCGEADIFVTVLLPLLDEASAANEEAFDVMMRYISNLGSPASVDDAFISQRCHISSPTNRQGDGVQDHQYACSSDANGDEAKESKDPIAVFRHFVSSEFCTVLLSKLKSVVMRSPVLRGYSTAAMPWIKRGVELRLDGNSGRDSLPNDTRYRVSGRFLLCTSESSISVYRMENATAQQMATVSSFLEYDGAITYHLVEKTTLPHKIEGTAVNKAFPHLVAVYTLTTVFILELTESDGKRRAVASFDLADPSFAMDASDAGITDVAWAALSQHEVFVTTPFAIFIFDVRKSLESFSMFLFERENVTDVHIIDMDRQACAVFVADGRLYLRKDLTHTAGMDTDQMEIPLFVGQLKGEPVTKLTVSDSWKSLLIHTDGMVFISSYTDLESEHGLQILAHYAVDCFFDVPCDTSIILSMSADRIRLHDKKRVFGSNMTASPLAQPLSYIGSIGSLLLFVENEARAKLVCVSVSPNASLLDVLTRDTSCHLPCGVQTSLRHVSRQYQSDILYSQDSALPSERWRQVNDTANVCLMRLCLKHEYQIAGVRLHVRCLSRSIAVSSNAFPGISTINIYKNGGEFDVLFDLGTIKHHSIILLTLESDSDLTVHESSILLARKTLSGNLNQFMLQRSEEPYVALLRCFSRNVCFNRPKAWVKDAIRQLNDLALSLDVPVHKRMLHEYAISLEADMKEMYIVPQSTRLKGPLPFLVQLSRCIREKKDTFFLVDEFHQMCLALQNDRDTRLSTCTTSREILALLVEAFVHFICQSDPVALETALYVMETAPVPFGSIFVQHLTESYFQSSLHPEWFRIQTMRQSTQKDNVTTYDDDLVYSCDVCGTTPITDTRYHCMDDACPDFDLCSACYSEKRFGASEHTQDHAMLSHAAPRSSMESGMPEHVEQLLVPTGIDPHDEAELLRRATEMSLQPLKDMETNPVQANYAAIVKAALGHLASTQNDSVVFNVMSFVLCCAYVGFELDDPSIASSVLDTSLWLLEADRSVHVHAAAVAVMMNMYREHPMSSKAFLQSQQTCLQSTSVLAKALPRILHLLPECIDRLNASKSIAERLYPRCSASASLCALLFHRDIASYAQLREPSIANRVFIAASVQLAAHEPTDSLNKEWESLCCRVLTQETLKDVHADADRLLRQCVPAMDERKKKKTESRFANEISNIHFGDEEARNMTYQDRCSIGTRLQTLLKHAKEEPAVFSLYVRSNTNAWSTFVHLSSLLDRELARLGLEALALVATERHEGDPAPLLRAVDLDSVLQRWTQHWLMKPSDKDVVVLLRDTLYFLWTLARAVDHRRAYLECISQLPRLLPLLGSHGAPIVSLLSLICSEATDIAPCAAREAIASCLVDLLSKGLSTLQQHSDTALYAFMERHVSLQSFPLYEEPCSVCLYPSSDSRTVSLRTLTAETKYTHTSIIARLYDTVQLHHIRLEWDSVSNGRQPRRIAVFMAQADALENLSSSDSRWELAVRQTQRTRESKVNLWFVPPCVGNNIKIVLEQLFPPMDALKEGLKCPRCEARVESKHGICGKCNENAHQCHQCRNINYDRLDATLCNECGFSRLFRYEVSATSSTWFATLPIRSEEDRSNAVQQLQDTMEKSQESIKTIADLRRSISMAQGFGMLQRQKDESVAETVSIAYNQALRTVESLAETEWAVSALQCSILGIDPALEPVRPSCYSCTHTLTLSLLHDVFKLIQSLQQPSEYAQSIANQLFSLMEVSLPQPLCKAVFAAFAQMESSTMATSALTRTQSIIQHDLACVGRNDAHFDHAVAFLCTYNEAVSTQYEQSRITALVHCLATGLALYCSNIYDRQLASYLVAMIEALTAALTGPCGLMNHDAMQNDLASASFRSNIMTAFFSPSIALRQALCDLLLAVAGSHRALQQRLLSHLTQHIPNALQQPAVAENLLDLMAQLCMRIEATHVDLDASLVEQIAAFIDSRTRAAETAERLVQRHAVSTTGLLGAVSLLTTVLHNDAVRRACRRNNTAATLLYSYLALRDLVLQRSIVTIRVSAALSEAIDVLFGDSLDDKRHLLEAYMLALASYSPSGAISGRTPVYILEQTNLLLAPPFKVPEVSLVLHKAESQEEFIRGSMRHNPYSSTALGAVVPTMKDVKDLICRELDLQDASDMFELLVANKLIHMSLPVHLVYDQVWKTSTHEEDDDSEVYDDMDGMLVTYRLQGLDGEATEDVVETLHVEEETQDPEERFAIADALTPYLDTLLQWLARPTADQDLDAKLDTLLVETLTYCSHIAANQTALGQDPVQHAHILVQKLATLYRRGSSDDELNRLVRLIQITVSNMPDSTHTAGKQSRDDVDCVMSCIDESVTGSPPTHLIQVLPSITFRSTELGERVFDRFQQHIQWESLQQDTVNTESVYYLSCLASYCESFGNLFAGLKEQARDLLIIATCFSLIDAIPISFNSSRSQLKAKADANPLLPYFLRILSGLCCNCLPNQEKALHGDVILKLFLLEGVASDSGVGSLCESLLETLSAGCPLVERAVQDLRQTRVEAKRVKAAQRRARMLRTMGIKQQENKLKAERSIRGMRSVKEEEGLRCLVCQEGYGIRPKQMMGIYVFNKEVESYKEEGEAAVSTVSHFNVIHYACHDEARRADAKLSPPKAEWDGAILRNSQTLCNNLLPILHANNDRSEYRARVEQYWSGMEGCEDVELSRFEVLEQDIGFLLRMFAFQESFSVYSRGGGMESNGKMLVYLFQMGLFSMQGMPKKEHEEYRSALTELLGNTAVAETELLECVVLLLFYGTKQQWDSGKAALWATAQRLDNARPLSLLLILVGSLMGALSKEWGDGSHTPKQRVDTAALQHERLLHEMEHHVLPCFEASLAMPVEQLCVDSTLMDEH